MRKLMCAAAACCVLAGSTAAMASPDFVLDGTSAEMSGKYAFRKFHLINGAKLTVKKGTDAQPDSGRLYVIAHEIVIDDTSSIDGTGAGYPGQLNGDGLPLAVGGGKGAIGGSDSGGGGGYGGKGGPGVFADCTLAPGALGGSMVGGNDAQPGSSGSAAGSKDGDNGGRGAAGGGMVDLRASRLKLLGQVIVDGEAGKVYDAEDCAGGGAGGGIWIQTSLLSGAGILSANGGSGGKSTKSEGGSGGGGKVFLRVDSQAAIFPSVIAGSSSCPAARGDVGIVDKSDTEGCLDLDEDGETSDACGGQDCDDSDDQVKPSGTEACNGQDDDCDGEIDDVAAADCAGGACVGGKCVATDGGEQPVDGGDAGHEDSSDADGGNDSGIDSGIEGGVPLSEVSNYEFRGGCAQAAGAHWGGWMGLCASAALMLARRVSSGRARGRTSASGAQQSA